MEDNRILETERVYMREMTQADFPSLCRILQDEETMYAYEGAFTDSEAQEWLDRQLARYQKWGFGLWAVILKETGEMIGQCGLTMQPWKDEEVLEIGYLFERQYWHKGYATEAAKACKQYAFEKLKADEVCSIIRDTNAASQNVALRNGMVIADTWTKHYRGVDMPHFRYAVSRRYHSERSIHIMNEPLIFADREAFRTWLSKNCLSEDGVWLLFGKAGGPKTIKASEALEEALCFGWIDGQMQSIDDKTYRKYFSMRRDKSKWSEKNKALVKDLEESGLMTNHGRKKIEEAKANGQWDASKPAAVTEERIAELAVILKAYEPAYTNFQAMPPSVKKTYTKAYLDAKTEAGREKRIAWMVDRLNRNLKPM